VALIAPARLLSQTPEPAGPPIKGHVLLLPNERIFEGDIEKVGDRFCIRRSGGGETWLPCDNAVRLCASRDEAYRYLRTQANLDDADERLRLARWCLMYEMRQQALAELTAADALRPNHAETCRLLGSVMRSAQNVAAASSPPLPSPTPAAPAENKGSQSISSGLELNNECMGLFARRVQPILINTCAKCHASGRAGEFKLTQVFGAAAITGRSSQQNLTAVLSQIKLDQPLSSPFLRMAASAHGGADQPPLRNRETPAYKALEQWVQLAAARAAKSAVLASDAPPLTPDRPAKNVFESVATKATKESTAVKRDELPTSKGEFASELQEKSAGPADEFDPVIFNRQMHPEKK
jgi:hypothetical protein